MKKVLVITDNLVIYLYFKKLVKKVEKFAEFIFKHSPTWSDLWQHEDFKNKKNSIINVKHSVDEIIKTYDLVISAHCKQYFPKELVSNIRCINIHPGYNPINRGWFPQVFAIIKDLKIGATIHEMDEKLDNGPIIAREFVEKFPWDTSLSLYNRVVEKEIELLENNIIAIIQNTYSTITPVDTGNFFVKEDFIELCEIDLNKTATFQEFYNLLRGLSHGMYKNAYFIDVETNKKIYISLNIEQENL